MRVKKLILIFCIKLVVIASVSIHDVNAAEAFRVWGCSENGCGYSWCNNLPGCSNCYNLHYICGWYGWYDSFDCDGNFINRYGGLSNRLTCVTHGGPYGGCCSVMGSGIYPHDCFAFGPYGCGPLDYGTKHCGDIDDVRTQAMKDGRCCPMGLCLLAHADKNLGTFPIGDMDIGCETSALTGNPVNIATGNKYEEVLDLTLPTPGIQLEFKRFYNSQLSNDGPLGYGWTHSYDLTIQVIQESPSKRVIVWDSNGRALYFTESLRTNEIIFMGESGVKDRLKQAGTPI